MEEQREAVQKAADAYIAEQYDANAKVAAAVYSKEGALTLCISGQACNLRNFWSGSWTSTYKIALAGTSSAKLSGKCKLLVHYFEDGNVQMNTQNEFSKDDISFATAEELGKAVRVVIKGWENELQNGWRPCTPACQTRRSRICAEFCQ